MVADDGWIGVTQPKSVMICHRRTFTVGSLRSEEAVSLKRGRNGLFEFWMKGACSRRFLVVLTTRPEEFWRRAKKVSISLCVIRQNSLVFYFIMLFELYSLFEGKA